MALGANYRKLWTASVVSNLGDGVAAVAYPWLASAVTRDPVQIALVGVATRIPWLVFTLPAGVITDRVDRRKLMVVADAFRFALTLLVAVAVWLGRSRFADPELVASGSAPSHPYAAAYLALLYGSALLFGFAEVLRDNAAQTLMPSLVDAGDLEKANGRLWGGETVMNSFVGPPLGGALIGVTLALPFFLDAGTFGIAAALVYLMSGAFRARPGIAQPRRPAWRSEIAAGLRWLWDHRLLRTLAIILGVMNALGAMVFATYVLFVQEVLGLDAARFGVLMTAGAIGGVAGSFTASRVSAAVGSGASLFATVLGGGLTMAVTGLTSSWGVVWSMFVIFSYLAVLWNVITVSLRQSIIPDHLLGRVNSVYRFFGWGMMPVGMLAGGIIVSLVTPLAGRIPALRAPFLVAAAVHLLLFLHALPRLNSAAIAAARTEAPREP